MITSCSPFSFYYAVERHFEGYEYKTLTHPHFAYRKPHEYRLFQPLLRDREPHNLERAQAVYPFATYAAADSPFGTSKPP